MATTIRVTTAARYRCLEVTIIGDLDAGLLAIAGYDTPQELAIAAIAVKHRGGRHVYRVAGVGGWTASLEEVASSAAHVGRARS
jgi:hypothetical protein